MMVSVRCQIVSGRGKAGGHFERIGRKSASAWDHALSRYAESGFENPVHLDGEKCISFENGKRRLWPARMADRNVYVYRTRSQPDHIFEVVSDVRLRDALSEAEVENLELAIEPAFVVPLNGWQKFLWRKFWSGRETDYYNDDQYLRFAKKWLRRLRYGKR
ncbi:MAG: hypothetical protein M9908_12215 [Phyllobacteriaceae bacterium]|nr:hypothetical protein [Phyllobacteriaceae bacterium]